MTHLLRLQFHPVTPGRWQDFDKLFSPNGACAGCWSRSVWWRLDRAAFSRKRYAGTKRMIKKIITTGQEPGILAYANGAPLAAAPRHAVLRQVKR